MVGMLRISRRADYAIRVMIAAAQTDADGFLPAPRIGEQMLIPKPFLSKIIGDLKRGGLVTTAPGRRGGVSLARPAEAITLRHIIEAVEGPVILNDCLTASGECIPGAFCPAHPAWRHIQGALHEQMDSCRLDLLARQMGGPHARLPADDTNNG